MITPLEILEAAFVDALQIVDKHIDNQYIEDNKDRLVAASNLAICLFSYHVENEATRPEDVDDDIDLEMT